jgi:hypothetical protein
MGGIEMASRAERAQGYRKEAEKYAKLAKSGQLDIANVHRTLAERYAWMAENSYPSRSKLIVKSPAVAMAMVQGVRQVSPSDDRASAPSGFD